MPYFGEPPRQIAGLPDNLALSPGRLEIRLVPRSIQAIHDLFGIGLLCGANYSVRRADKT